MLKNKEYFFLNLICIVLLLVLPFYIFQGKLFIGGDDGRLLSLYPSEHIRQIAFFSWFHFSSTGFNNVPQFLLPILSVLSLLDVLITSKMLLSYLFFSMPLVLGFIYFQKFILTVFKPEPKYQWAAMCGALFYILSPITLVNQLSVFLYAIWLMPLIPLLLFYFVRYINTGNFKNVVYATAWGTLLSLGLFSIPWLLGFVLPALFAMTVLAAIINKKLLSNLVKKSVIFFGTIALANSFWLIPFASTFTGGGPGDFGANAVSSSVADTFSPTVKATATGSVLYPLVNLFHRQIAFDFNWSLKQDFLSFYDHIIFFNLVFVLIVFAGVYLHRKQLAQKEKLLYLGCLIAFITSLFLFTVNIGPLKSVFLSFGQLPGFGMFRNFYDKFALGYIFIYAFLLTFSLIIICRRLDRGKYSILCAAVLLLVIINALPIRRLVVKPLWTTKQTYTNITIPSEYIDFMSKVKVSVPTSTNILSLPFGASAYTIIKDASANSVYAGRSPVQLFTGVNDFSGNLSYSPEEALLFNKLLAARDYGQLNQFLKKYNINYVFVTKNIPQEVKESYLFNQESLKYQDDALIKALTSRKIVTSQDGNYELYETKHSVPLISSSATLFNFKNDKTPRLMVSDENHSKFTQSFGESNIVTTKNNDSVYAHQVSSLFEERVNKNGSLIDELDSGKAPSHKLYKNQGNASLYLEKTRNRIDILSKTPSDLSLNNKLAIFENLPPNNLLSYQIDPRLRYYLKLDELHVPIQTEETRGLGPLNNFRNASLYSQGVNQIANPSFESGFWQDKVSDCNGYDNNPRLGMKLGKQDSTDGKQSLQLEATRHIACTTTKIKLSTQGEYLLGFDYKSPTKSPAGYSLQFNDSDKTTVAGKLPNEQTNKWETFIKPITVPNSATEATLYVYAYESDGHSNNIVQYDNLNFSKAVVLKSVDLPVPKDNFQATTIKLNPFKNEFKISNTGIDDSNLISNPSFEEGLWNKAVDDCHSYDNKSKLGMKLEGKNKTDGKQSLQLEATRHTACTSKDISIKAGGDHLLSFDVQGQKTKQAGYYLQFNDDKKRVINEKIDIEKPEQWQEFKKKIAVPAGATSATLTVYAYESDGKTKNITRYDNFKFIKVPDLDNTYYMLTEPEKQLAAPQQINYSSVNPTKKAVAVAGATKPFVLSFAESFHPGWKLYLKPIDGDGKEDCKSVRTYEPPAGSKESKVEQCSTKQRFAGSNDIGLLGQKPVFDGEQEHIKLNGYSNGWIVDPDFVKANYSKEFYRENADGSVDLNIVMYFKPQSYFYVGLIISGATLTACLAYLVYDWRKRRGISGDPPKKPLRRLKKRSVHKAP